MPKSRIARRSTPLLAELDYKVEWHILFGNSVPMMITDLTWLTERGDLCGYVLPNGSAAHTPLNEVAMNAVWARHTIAEWARHDLS